MTIDEAVQSLYTALDVDHWNVIRETIRNQVNPQEWHQKYVPVIDGSGLIVKVLGPDGPEDEQEN